MTDDAITDAKLEEWTALPASVNCDDVGRLIDALRARVAELEGESQAATDTTVELIRVRDALYESIDALRQQLADAQAALALAHERVEAYLHDSSLPVIAYTMLHDLSTYLSQPSTQRAAEAVAAMVDGLSTIIRCAGPGNCWTEIAERAREPWRRLVGGKEE